MTTYVLTRGAMDTIRYYVSHTSGFTITPVIIRGGGAGTATWDWGDGSATETGDSMNHVYAAGTYTVTLTLVDYPTYLMSIAVHEDHVVGDFLWALRSARALTAIIARTNTGLNSNCALVNLSGWWPSLISIYIYSTGVSGDISGWVLPASLINLSIYATSVSGDISGWVLPASLDYFLVNSTSVSGDISGWTLPASLVDLRIYATGVSGDISGWVLPASLVDLRIYATGVSGDISGWVLPASLINLRIYATGVSGDISGWVLPASLINLRLYATGVSGVPIFTSAVALRDVYYQDCALPQATCDAFLAAIWARRMSFTNAAPGGNIGGTNATPGGIYQNANPPTTGLEYKHVLVNDGNVEGFNKWAWTTS